MEQHIAYLRHLVSLYAENDEPMYRAAIDGKSAFIRSRVNFELSRHHADLRDEIPPRVWRETIQSEVDAFVDLVQLEHEPTVVI